MVYARLSPGVPSACQLPSPVPKVVAWAASSVSVPLKIEVGDGSQGRPG